MAEKTKAETIPQETIFVRARPELAGRTALWERHPAHPDGEVFVQGDEVVEVAQTPEVMARLAPRLQDGGALVRLEGDALKQAQKIEVLRREQAAQSRIAAQGGAVALPAVLESRPSASPEEVTRAHERVAVLEKQIESLTARIEQATAPVEVPTGAGDATSEQAVAGAKPAKPSEK